MLPVDMETLRDFWWQLRESPIFAGLPVEWRDSPWFWLALPAALVLVTLATRTWKQRSGSMNRRLLREANELMRRGETAEAGAAWEALGKTRKALATYKRGGHHQERAELLLRLGRRKEAKSVARDGGATRLYGELCREDGELEEAAVAFERSGQAYLAAQCYAEAGVGLEAARCYLAAGMEAEAVRLLQGEEGEEAAELLDDAVRSSISQMGISGLSLELQEAVQRGVQLWLSVGRPERAFRLAVDADRMNLAVPVARDYLEPTVEVAEICARSGAHSVAADLYARLGEVRLEALQRAEAAQLKDDRAEAAEWLEKAEEWAAAADLWAAVGKTRRAAELFSKAGDAHSAAQLLDPGSVRPMDVGAQPWLTQAHVGDLEDELATRLPGSATARAASVSVDPQHPTIPSVFPAVGGAETSVGGAETSVGGAETAVAGEVASRLPPTSPAGEPTVPARPPAAHPPAATVPAATVPVAEPTESTPRYALVRELGRGGMGIVYLAEDRVLQRQVAYKILPEHSLGVELEPESLLAEARAAARLSHPNIVQVFDAGRHGKGFYVVMEFIQGQTLDEILAEKQITVAGALRIGLQVCAALDHAHRRQIIHRDLKPSNLMWSEDRLVKLADFGLARAFDAGEGRVLTQPAGTPSYMAPEQIRGEAVSPAVDIYSFGCVLFELLCRESVFGAGPPSFHHHLSTPPRDPRQLRSDVGEPLAELILRCLAKDPDQRPGSAAELGQALAGLLKDLP